MLPVEIQTHIDSLRRRLELFRTPDSEIAALKRRDRLGELLRRKEQNDIFHEAILDLELLEAAIAKDGGGDE